MKEREKRVWAIARDIFPLRGSFGLMEEFAIAENVLDARYQKCAWHDFRKEKPAENGRYAAIIPLEGGGSYFDSLNYYKESKMFNWNGKGDDTHIDVLYWAKEEDILAQAKEGTR